MTRREAKSRHAVKHDGSFPETNSASVGWQLQWLFKTVCDARLLSSICALHLPGAIYWSTFNAITGWVSQTA